MGKRVSLIGLCLVIAFVVGSITAHADSPIRVLADQHTAQFAKGISFRIVAEADQPIQSVTLYYGEQKGDVTNRVVPSFTPGQHIEATYDKPLERGEIPPGTVMEYHWRLQLADGTLQDTEPQVFSYDDDRFPWQPVQAGNLTVLYYGGDAQKTLAQELLSRAQETLSRLQTEIGITLQSPVHIYVYNSAEDMTAALSPRSQGFDEQVLTLGVAVSDDTLLLLGDHPEVQQTISHELSHIVVGLATENPYSPVPRWLDEGLAMYAEGKLPANNVTALQQAVKRDALISVRSLSSYTGDPQQVDLYYGEVYSLVEYMLQTYGRDKMTALLQVFKQGALQDDALQQVYHISLDTLDTQWRQSLGLGPRPTVTPTSAVAAVTPPAPVQAQRSGLLCPLTGIIGAITLAIGLALRRVLAS